MPRPLIGLTTHSSADPDRAELDILLAMVVRGLERALGLPLIIPFGVEDETLREIYARLDGVLLPGGGDVAPEQYQSALHPRMGGIDRERDRVELALARWATDDALPFFGICRGAQVVNVARGGALFRDVEEHPGALRHSYAPQLALRPHAVKVEEDSTLARVLGQPILSVNSLHHQTCRELGRGLRAVAFAPDGHIEAIELPQDQHPFALAVQWHPESLPDAPEQRALFEAFVKAAKSRMTMG
jgi:putative glutamine amidotransferase